MRKILCFLLISFLMATIGCRTPFPSDSAADAISDIPPPDSMVSDTESTVTSGEDTVVSDSEVKTDDITSKNEMSNNTSAIPSANEDNTFFAEDKPSEPIQEDNSSITDKAAAPIESVQYAGEGDESVITELIVKEINRYRTKLSVPVAVNLSGLTKYAEYRSRQLVGNFAHDTADERAAATALKYGMYVDPALYGMSGEPYYTACANEAIVKAGYCGTVEYVAESISALVRQSSMHWNYVGSIDYCYIAVGVTYEGGLWYVDIAMSKTDVYEN